MNQSEKARATIGLDLGTTNSCVTFTNALGASIVAESVGVFISGDSEILTTAGDITAGSAGFVVGGDATTLQNSGNITVTATNARAISVAGSATTLDNSGTITSAGHGIMVAGDVGSFTNSGTITTTGGENTAAVRVLGKVTGSCLLYTSPSPRDS